MQALLDHAHKTEDYSTGSGTAFAFAQYWLNDCMTHHKLCRSIQPRKTALPSRVIDVGPSDGSQEPVLYLTNGATGPYIALSYCWGNSDIAKTNSHNVKERLQRIQIEDLPQTYRDLIEVARRFEVRYVWIDAICIVQDSRDDWLAESRKMSDYYRNASITVAAACSGNAAGGLFQKRDASWIRPCRFGAKKFCCGCELWEEEVAPINPLPQSSEDGNIESTPHGSQVKVSPSSRTLEPNVVEAALNSIEAAGRGLSGVNSSAAEEFVDPSELPHKFSPDTRENTALIDVRVGDQDNCYYYVLPPFHRNDDGDMYRPRGPLDRRAWTLQERILSTRVLSYGTDEIHWECCEGEASERMPEGLQDRRQEEQDAWKEDCCEYVVPMRLSLANSPKEYSPSEIDERNFWRLSSWHRLVEDYCERRLTYDGDRLVAFFGLMTRMGTSLGSEVIAGLREPVLWYDLLWRALKKSDKHGEGEQRRASSIAPSWSWVSIGRSIAYGATKSPYRRLERMMNSWSIEISKDEVDSVEATLIVNTKVKGAWATASDG